MRQRRIQFAQSYPSISTDLAVVAFDLIAGVQIRAVRGRFALIGPSDERAAPSLVDREPF
jgi:hypothetical protein